MPPPPRVSSQLVAAHDLVPKWTSTQMNQQLHLECPPSTGARRKNQILSALGGRASMLWGACPTVGRQWPVLLFGQDTSTTTLLSPLPSAPPSAPWPPACCALPPQVLQQHLAQLRWPHPATNILGKLKHLKAPLKQLTINDFLSK